MKSVSIRFYEELNDFLRVEKRKVRFDQDFRGNPSAKDFIESLGVPHTEVDLILVNGLSVDFSYLLKDKDDIAVYPVFESMDIGSLQHLREAPLRQPKFILDVHLGALAKYLRMLGQDSVYSNSFGDVEIIEKSLNEGRAILTRDTGLLKRKAVLRGYFVRNIYPEKQVKEVIFRFDLLNSIKLFTRCLLCNGLLKPGSKEEILEKLPPNVRNNKNEFYICEACNKIYWQGSHWENMNKLASRLLVVED